MILPSLDFVELSGSATDIAYQLGQARNGKIHQAVRYWNDFVFEKYRGRRNELKALEQTFFSYASREAPLYLREIEAMAEGAGVRFADLFRLNVTEIGVFADKCTDLIFRVQSRGRLGILLAHNEDWNPERNDIFILKARLPGLSYATLAYNGYLPGLSAGMNSFGLCHSVNYLYPRDCRPGLPRIFIARHLVSSPSPRDCLGFIGGVTRAFGQAIHLAIGKDYWSLELSSRRWVRRRPRLPAVHTNHYLSPRLKNQEGFPAKSSEMRLKTAQKLLKEGTKVPSAQGLARRILSDRSSFPYAIWRQADHKGETSATLAAVLLRSDQMKMEVFRGPPTRSIPLRIKL